MNELIVLLFLILGVVGLRRAWREKRGWTSAVTVVSGLFIVIGVVWAVSTGAFQPS